MPALNRRRYVVAAILTLLSLVGLYFLIPKLVGLKETWGELKRGDPLLLVLAGLLEMLSVGGYVVLFHTVFHSSSKRITWRASVEIALAGIAAIRLLAAAGAGGIAVSAWALRRAGVAAATIVRRMVATYAIQYSIYIGALIVCGLGLWSGVIAGGGTFGITVVPALFGLLLLALFLGMALVPDDFQRRLDRLARRRDRIGSWAVRLASAPAIVGAGVRTALALARERPIGLLGALAYWGLDITVLGLSFQAFGQGMSLGVLIMGYFLGTLGSLLPLPGGIGGVEGGMIGAFVVFGIPDGRALIGVLVYRAISFWLPTLPGIFGYVRLRRTARDWRQADEQPARAFNA